MKQFLHADGSPVTLGIRPADPTLGTTPAVMVAEETALMADKAPRTGVYELNGARFHVNEGDDLPEGATFRDAVEARANKAAPENKAKATAPAKKAE